MEVFENATKNYITCISKLACSIEKRRERVDRLKLQFMVIVKKEEIEFYMGPKELRK